MYFFLCRKQTKERRVYIWVLGVKMPLFYRFPKFPKSSKEKCQKGITLPHSQKPF